MAKNKKGKEVRLEADFPRVDFGLEAERAAEKEAHRL
jgi:hypothetical protein